MITSKLPLSCKQFRAFLKVALPYQEKLVADSDHHKPWSALLTVRLDNISGCVFVQRDESLLAQVTCAPKHVPQEMLV